MKLINGHLSYKHKNQWEIDECLAIYKLFISDEVLYKQFKEYFIIGNIPLEERNWYICCSLLGLIENKTAEQLVQESIGPESTERIRQIFNKFKRMYRKFIVNYGLITNDRV